MIDGSARRPRRLTGTRPHRSTPNAATVSPTATAYEPAPASTPTAETAQTLAAVVSPRMVFGVRQIVPAPRNPTPTTIWAATRAGSRTVPWPTKP